MPAEKQVPSLYVNSPSFCPILIKTGYYNCRQILKKNFPTRSCIKICNTKFYKHNFVVVAKFHSNASKNGRVVIRDSKLRNMGFLFPKLFSFYEERTRIFEPFTCGTCLYIPPVLQQISYSLYP